MIKQFTTHKINNKQKPLIFKKAQKKIKKEEPQKRDLIKEKISFFKEKFYQILQEQEDRKVEMEIMKKIQLEKAKQEIEREEAYDSES